MSTPNTALLPTRPALRVDPLWALTAECAADPRPHRLDLIIGVYRDESGRCPTFAAVRAAELELAAASPGKQYTGLSGHAGFTAAMTGLLLGDPALQARATTVQTVAGTGALRVLAEFLAATGPERTVHLGTPAYVNHPAVLAAAGLRTEPYPVLRPGAVLETAERAARGDVLLVQGCCHNPTGTGLSRQEWRRLAEICTRRGLVPFVDQAYYGLGDGLTEDLAGMRDLLEAVPDAVVAVSGSKAFGLYSDRVGCAVVLTADPAHGRYARGMLESIARADYSQPPAHGAQVVAHILGDPVLRGQWRSELEAMRVRLTDLRSALTAAIGNPDGSGLFAGLAQQRGMFARLPLTDAEMTRLRQDHAIHGLPGGRINLAGLPASRIPDVADAVRTVVGRRNKSATPGSSSEA
jgi:aspartate aminotransferase